MAIAKGGQSCPTKCWTRARCVKQHITDMLAKTGFRSRLQLAVRARGGGLVINDSEPE